MIRETWLYDFEDKIIANTLLLRNFYAVQVTLNSATQLHIGNFVAFKKSFGAYNRNDV